MKVSVFDIQVDRVWLTALLFAFFTMILTLSFHLPETARSLNTGETWERNLLAPTLNNSFVSYSLLPNTIPFFFMNTKLIDT